MILDMLLQQVIYEVQVEQQLHQLNYSSTTGIVTFSSNDVGYTFTTGDSRGTSGGTTTSTQLAGLLNTTQFINL